MRLRVIVERDEDDVFVAEVPQLPGCISQGATHDEARRNIREAAQGYLDSLRARGEPLPRGFTEETIEVA